MSAKAAGVLLSVWPVHHGPVYRSMQHGKSLLVVLHAGGDQLAVEFVKSPRLCGKF